MTGHEHEQWVQGVRAGHRWKARLERVAQITAAALTADDTAFEQLYATVRAAYAAGRSIPHLAAVTGLSRGGVRNALHGDSPDPWTPWTTDEALRGAVQAARAADAAYVAARRARDAMVRQACKDAPLTHREIGEVVGLRRDQVGYLHRHPGYNPQSKRMHAFRGMDVDAYRASRRAIQRQRKPRP